MGAHDQVRNHLHALTARPVAYFSAEFGLRESVPIYSGGLGVLSGDHLKSAADLGVPLVAVGLLYRQGYFQQRLDAEGWQQESYLSADPAEWPARPVLDAGGEPLHVRVETRGSVIAAAVWEMGVGGVRLLLLDTDVSDNGAEDRALTARLYGGDRETRIRQELVLGVGGVRALAGAGIDPSVLHLNEGHSAFAGLEMARQRVADEGIALDEAMHLVARQTVFTTHTPVAAGHDRFEPALVEQTLGPLREALGMDERALLSLGRVGSGDDEKFCMTVLALKTSRRANGVSALHGEVSRQMWQSLWPGDNSDGVPIGHITNGVHVPTWMGAAMGELLDGTLEAGWRSKQSDPATWAAVAELPDESLWSAHMAQKRALINFVRSRAAAEAEQRGESDEVARTLGGALSEDALLVGFARRFAPYKRASLLLGDTAWLEALVNDADRPVRFVFAGKAHPRDDEGKKILQAVHRATRSPALLGKVVLLENYDMAVGRALTSGVDVWLNNPRRPLEASGTSGQKVIYNGGLNCSVLDGWWAEAYDGQNGFAIGPARAHRDVETQDARDAGALQSVLEAEVARLYYDRTGDLPEAWIARMKRSMTTLGWRFCADRMVEDYALRCYLPASGMQAAHVD